jgi:predicted GIY-YIG superfamily endonuclease
MTVYLLHFETRYKHAGHYTGIARDLDKRLEEHRSGQGARLTQVVRQAGIDFVVARTWKGDRKKERSLKNQGGASRHCPLCKAQRRGTAR